MSGHPMASDKAQAVFDAMADGAGCQIQRVKNTFLYTCGQQPTIGWVGEHITPSDVHIRVCQECADRVTLNKTWLIRYDTEEKA